MARIYLVDDHALVRDGLRAMVEAGGHSVVGVGDEPTGALAHVLHLRPDLLLLDLNLADGRSGIELLTELDRRSSPIRTLVLTMSAKARDVAAAIQLGAAGYLLKNAPRAELLAAIEIVMSGRHDLGPDVGDLAIQALRTGGETGLLAQLSNRERQILSMVVRGRTSPAIGQILHLSPRTVDTIAAA